MEFAQKELNLEGAIEQTRQTEASPLTDLQLALVGGGCGEVVFH
jgi:hypothetical protein